MPEQPRDFPEDKAARLAAALRQRLDGEVRFDAMARALYATDASNYRQPPIGVVIPRHVEDVEAAVAVCRAHDAPVLPRGCGTSLAGQTCNVAVVIDMTKYVNRIIDIDYERQRARVQPGCIFDRLRDIVEPHGQTVAFDTSTHGQATIGGMIGNNSCGVHSVLAQRQGAGSGRTADNIEELEILTYDGLRLRVGQTSEAEVGEIIQAGGRRGEIYAGLRDLRDRYAALIRDRYPDVPRRVSGYNLNQLLPENGFNVARALVGSEGTCVTVLEATVRLIDSPPERVLLVLGYPDICRAGDHAQEVMEAGPVGLEAIDRRLVDNLKRKHQHAAEISLLPDGGGFLLAEFGGASREEAEACARSLMERLGAHADPPRMALFCDPGAQDAIWLLRESGLGATANVPGGDDTWPGWEDSAVPPDRLGDYLRDLRALYDRYGYDAALYGHFGQGCVHTRINFDIRSEAGIRKWRAFLDDGAELVARFGGSLSGEHGDGQARAALLPKMFGPEIVEAFGAFKAIWDPRGRMNPGKIVDPYPITANLRFGPVQEVPVTQTYFGYPEDEGKVSRAFERCVGVGKCRQWGGGVMCPSFMATHDEKDTTRGRARMLFEMIHGGIIRDGWKSRAVRESLDLCLACKGCKRDCPVNVDMATYKAEFMAHHYKGRLRPRAAYSMGLIYWWSRLAALAPGAVNAVLRAPALSALVKKVGGIAPQRAFPRYAGRTFTEAFRRRSLAGGGRGEVLLFPDTFTNHFHPEIGIAAVEVLEYLGFRVRIPERSLCCGRPLYAEGMLDLARRQLSRILDTLGPAVEAGTPIIGLEPSCVAAFRDELVNMFPQDRRAQALARNTVLLGEFLARSGCDLPALSGRAVVHFHCNHHAVLDPQADVAVLSGLGLDLEVLDAGCCGMAGSFGFEAEHYDLSMACAERVLLPAVRGMAGGDLFVTDGFSCREQVVQATGRQPLHLAQVLRRALG